MESIDQKLPLRNFDARHEKIETGAVVKSHRRLSGVERGKGICYKWKEKGSARREIDAVSSMRVTIVQNRHRKPHHPLSHKIRKHDAEVCREKEMPEAEAHLRISIDRGVNTS